ncbi:UNVERIFIED_CONTAM: F-box protein SKIP24 [Sesamum radiatum]|uniref:F-box protein SKIP24 n=1 Tax=Sesamum radiatum TaxID=300843 RepID=A0AAW2NAM9_SESRA
MSMLPDELWTRIMELGIQTKTLDHKNLCCLSITCRRLHRLAADDSLWSCLLLSDFPSSARDFNFLKNNDNSTSTVRDNNCSSSSAANVKFKSLYRIRYEKDREQKRLAHRRVVLRIESEIAERLRKIQEIELQTSTEKEKMNKAVAELVNVHKVRQASVALNVWQPEIIRGRQRQMIQQSNVPVDFRINALEMELSLCKQQIAGFDKALRVEKRRLDEAKEQLASVKYHPLQDFSSTSCQQNECRNRSKKLKHTSTVKFQVLFVLYSQIVS